MVLTDFHVDKLKKKIAFFDGDNGAELRGQNAYLIFVWDDPDNPRAWQTYAMFWNHHYGYRTLFMLEEAGKLAAGVALCCPNDSIELADGRKKP